MNYKDYISGKIPVTFEILKELIKNENNVTRLNTSEITNMNSLFYQNKIFQE